MPVEDRPKSELDEYRLFPEWEDSLNQELASWKAELEKLESKVPDGRLIYNSARERVLQVLESVAHEDGLLPQTSPRRGRPTRKQVIEESSPAPADMSGWMSFVKLSEWGNTDPAKGASVKPMRFREPNDNERLVKSWPDLLFQTAEWLVKKGLIVRDNCPVTVGSGKRFLINSKPVNSKGKEFHGAKKLSNGLYIEGNISAKDAARVCEQLLTKFGQDPAQFHVQLG